MGVIIDIVAKLAAMGVNITDNQRTYLEWRTSEDGRKYFKRKADNIFYNALAKGDTSVIDVAIHEKQETINRLKKELGLSVIVCAFLLFPGCQTIPPRTDVLTPNALKTAEHTYTIHDMSLRTDQGPEVLTGQWHIVSSDFMKDHVRNQDTLIEVLQKLKSTETMVFYSQSFCVSLLVLGFLIAVWHGR